MEIIMVLFSHEITKFFHLISYHVIRIIIREKWVLDEQWQDHLLHSCWNYDLGLLKDTASKFWSHVLWSLLTDGFPTQRAINAYKAHMGFQHLQNTFIFLWNALQLFHHLFSQCSLFGTCRCMSQISQYALVLAQIIVVLLWNMCFRQEITLSWFKMLKLKGHHIDEFVVTGCTGSWNLQCCWWQQIH